MVDLILDILLRVEGWNHDLQFVEAEYAEFPYGGQSIRMKGQGTELGLTAVYRLPWL